MKIDAQNILLNQLLAENPGITLKEFLEIITEIDAITQTENYAARFIQSKSHYAEEA